MRPSGDFPDGPVGTTPWSQCRMPGALDTGLNFYSLFWNFLHHCTSLLIGLSVLLLPLWSLISFHQPIRILLKHMSDHFTLLLKTQWKAPIYLLRIKSTFPPYYLVTSYFSNRTTYSLGLATPAFLV